MITTMYTYMYKIESNRTYINDSYIKTRTTVHDNNFKTTTVHDNNFKTTIVHDNNITCNAYFVIWKVCSTNSCKIIVRNFLQNLIAPNHTRASRLFYYDTILLPT